jgi:NAD(P)-dependent dehydrogenase (short-subunit alcohol dehydrogenase family)
MKLSNKVAVVTGASTGIGRAVAIELAKNGAIVYLVARRVEKLTETKKIIEANNGQAEIMTADLSDLESINKLIVRIKQETGRVDILVNIAGIWHGDDEVYAGKDFASFKQKVILDTYMVGLTAPTLLAQSLVLLMPPKSKVINLSGTFENGAKGWLPYYVSKRGIEDLTIGLSQELKDKEIQVFGISPSDTATEAYKHYFPEYIKEAIEPDKIALFMVKLCNDDFIESSGKIFVLKKDKEPFEGFHY